MKNVIKQTHLGEDVLRRQLESQFNLDYKGPGLYLTENYTIVVTADTPSHGEQASEDRSYWKSGQFHVYTFDQNISKTFFAPGRSLKIVSDLRQVKPALPGSMIVSYK